MVQPSQAFASMSLARQGGFSLAELMIAAAIGVILLAAVSSVVVTSNESYRELHRRNERMENGRIALWILATELQHAGFYGESNSTYAVPAAAPSPCETDPAKIESALTIAVHGYNDVTTSSTLPACIPTAKLVDNTDIITIRRASTQTTDQDDDKIIDADEIRSGAIHIQTGGGDTVVATGTNVPTDDGATFNLNNKDGSRSAIRAMVVNTYYVAKCNICDGEHADTIPTLKRQELSFSGGAPIQLEVPLVEGIEQLQITYGVDSNGDGAPDAYRTANNLATLTDWTNVVNVQLDIISRSLEPTPDYIGETSYTLGAFGAWTPAAAVRNYKRHAATTTIRLENIAGRREN